MFLQIELDDRTVDSQEFHIFLQRTSSDQSADATEPVDADFHLRHRNKMKLNDLIEFEAPFSQCDNEGRKREKIDLG